MTNFDDLTPEALVDERLRLRNLEKRLHAEAYDKVHAIERKLVQQEYFTRERDKKIAKLRAAKVVWPWEMIVLLITFAFGFGVIVGSILN